jgi:hypothetical protein
MRSARHAPSRPLRRHYFAETIVQEEADFEITFCDLKPGFAIKVT